MIARTTTTLVLIGAATLASGCGGGGGGGSGSSAAGISSSTPAGTTSGATGGTGNTGNTGGNDRAPPVITLTAPTRGLFTTATQVRVEGSVVDASGVAYLTINGAAVLPGAGGVFGHVVTLTSGLNSIELEAADPRGNRTRSVVPVVSGQYLPENSLVGDAFAVRLNRGAFDAIEGLAAAQLAGADLRQRILAQNPLFTGSAAGATLSVNATNATFGTALLDLDPQAGGLGVRVDVPNVRVRVRASARLLVTVNADIDVTADRAILTARAVVAVGPNGAVTTTLQNVVVTLQNFRFDINLVPGTVLENLARDRVRAILEQKVREQVQAVVPHEINRAIAGANGPVTRTVLGKPVTLRVVPTAVVFDTMGCSIRTNGDVSLPAVAGLPTTPGSLTTAGAAPAHATTPELHVSINDDLLNRAAHAAWRGGLMNLVIDQSRAQQLGLPAGVQLDAFMLQVFFPQLAGQVNPRDPVEIELSSATPLLFRTRPQGPGLLEAAIGDLTIAVYVAPAGQARVLVLEVAAQVQVGAEASVVGNTLRVSVAGRPVIKSDVIETPVVGFDVVAVETFLDFVLPPAIQLLPQTLSGFPLPVHPGLTPTNVQATTDGPQGDFVTIKGDL